MSIGTPGQTVKVAIDTGSDELWVDPNCDDADLSTSQQQECQADGQYNPSDSSTVNVLNSTSEIEYGKGAVEIEYVTDNVAVPDSTINLTSIQFGVAEETQDLNEGILGLGFGKGLNLPYNNFVDELTIENQTSSRAFSVALGSVSADNGGVLIFGGVDTKKFTGSLVSNTILGPQNGEELNRYWIQMTGIALNKSGSSTKQYADADLPVVLDSGSSLSYLPSSIVSSMADDFDATYDSDSELYQVPCSQAQSSGSVDFSFGDAKISVPFNEFIWQYSDQLCILGVVPATGTGTTSLLGDTFLRSAYVVFDQTTMTISMAQYANCGQNEQAIPASGAGNLTGECDASAATKSAGGRTTFSLASLAIAAVAGLAVAL